MTSQTFDINEAIKRYFEAIPANTSPETIKAAIDAMVAAAKA